MYIYIIWLTRCRGENHCINIPNTRLLDNQIGHLRWNLPSHLQLRNITLDDFIDDSMCELPSVNNDTPYNVRGMCPWTVVGDTDENRFPMRLNVAKCRCSTCTDNFECRPIFYTVPVLRRVCRRGVNRWIQKIEYISVACYCIRPQTRRVYRRRLS